MKRITFSILVPLLSVACGSSPVAPTSTPVQSAPDVLGFSLQTFSIGDSPQGWGSPTTFTANAFTRAGGSALVESATFKMFNAQGETLTEASIDSKSPIPPDGIVVGNTVAQTLTWSIEKGYGTRLDLILNLRLPSGELKTVSFSVPHPPSRQ